MKVFTLWHLLYTNNQIYFNLYYKSISVVLVLIFVEIATDFFILILLIRSCIDLLIYYYILINISKKKKLLMYYEQG